MKKSYNPFKMWGSYVGAFGLGFIGFLSSGKINAIFCNTPTCNPFFNDVGAFLFFLPIGFLLGWGIHSIFRIFRGIKNLK